MNALVKLEATTEISVMTEAELIGVLQTSLYPGASVPSIKLVLNYCKARNLDVMQKPAHIVPMWDNKAKQMRDVVMPGVGMYRTQAARSGQLAGISEPEFGPDKEFELGGYKFSAPEWCRVTVQRLVGGKEREFTAREYWIENYATAGKDTTAPNAMWKKRPRGQLAKCAQSQALRLAFPEETGAQQTSDEMEGKTLDDERVIDMPATTVQPAPEFYPQDKFEVNLPKWREAIEAGKKTPGDVIAFIQSRQPLTEQQKAVILSIKKREPEPAAVNELDGGPVVTFDEVAAKLGAARNRDELDEEATLIDAVPGGEEPKEKLVEIYQRRAKELAQ